MRATKGWRKRKVAGSSIEVTRYYVSSATKLHYSTNPEIRITLQTNDNYQFAIHMTIAETSKLVEHLRDHIHYASTDEAPHA